MTNIEQSFGRQESNGSFDQRERLTHVALRTGKFLERFSARQLLPRRFATRLALGLGVVAIPAALNPDLALGAANTTPIVRSVGNPSLSLRQGSGNDNEEIINTPISGAEKPLLQDKEPNLDLDKKLDDLFEKFKKEVLAEVKGNGKNEVNIPTSIEEATDFYNNLNAKQKAALFMYGLMAFYTLRAAGRYTKAFVDPRGDIDPKHLGSLKDHAVNNLTWGKVSFGERGEALKDAIVKDPQNRRTALALGGFTTASIIGADAGEMGSIELNLTLTIASLLAAIQPAFRAFARFAEKIQLEVIQKTAPFAAGCLFGIVGAGLFYGSKDIAVLNGYLAASTFATLFAYADMSIASREYFASFVDTLNYSEDLRRFHVRLISKRLPDIDDEIFKALVEGRGRVHVLNPTLDEQGKVVKKALLDEAFEKLELAYSEDGQADIELDEPLPELKEAVRKAIEDFINKKEIEKERDSRNIGRRRRRGGVIFK